MLVFFVFGFLNIFEEEKNYYVKYFVIQIDQGLLISVFFQVFLVQLLFLDVLFIVLKNEVQRLLFVINVR